MMSSIASCHVTICRVSYREGLGMESLILREKKHQTYIVRNLHRKNLVLIKLQLFQVTRDLRTLSQICKARFWWTPIKPVTMTLRPRHGSHYELNQVKYADKTVFSPLIYIFSANFEDSRSSLILEAD